VNVLLWSLSFAPKVGGLESAAYLIARELVALGHQIIVVTATEAGGTSDRRASFRVCRNPGKRMLMRLGRWSDVILHNHLNLLPCWPLLLVRRPWVVTYQSWPADGGRMQSPKRWVKRLLLARTATVSISLAVADRYNRPSVTIGNPYDETIFKRDDTVTRDEDLIFVGRLVSDKGAADAVRALALLQGRGLYPSLSIVGEGPERPELEALAEQSGTVNQVTFHGTKIKRELAALINRHRIMVVPSRWEEPFGIVALEGIACGCVPVVSSGGGLPEAAGPCGPAFQNGNAGALANALETLMRDPLRVAQYRAAAEPHLAKFSSAAVARRYSAVLTTAARRSGLSSVSAKTIPIVRKHEDRWGGDCDTFRT